MSQMYGVTLTIKDLNEQEASDALRCYIRDNDGKGVNFSLEDYAKEGITPDSFDGLMKIFLGGWKECEFEKSENAGEITYTNVFYGSYGWDKELVAMFGLLAPYISEGSTFERSGDNYTTVLKVGQEHEVFDVTYGFECNDDLADSFQQYMEEEFDLASAAPHLVRNIIDYVFAQHEDAEVTVAELAMLLEGTGVEEDDIIRELRTRSKA